MVAHPSRRRGARHRARIRATRWRLLKMRSSSKAAWSGARYRRASLTMRPLTSTTSLHQRTTAVGDRPECLLGGNSRNQLVIVVRIFRFFRLLDFEQIHRVDDAPILTDRDVAEQFVLAFKLLHLRYDVLGMVASGCRHRIEIRQ